MNVKSNRVPQLNILLYKNIFAVILPAIIVFSVVVYVSIYHSIVYKSVNHHVDELNDIQQWYERHCYNVQYRLTNLKYTGYDYYENGRRIGAYYYSFVEDRCVFVLVKGKNPEPVITSKNVRGRILKDSAHWEAMMEGFVNDTGLDKDDMNSIVYPYMISAIDYPIMENLIIWIVIVIPFLVSGTLIVLSIVWIIRPELHHCTKTLEDIGDRRLVFQEIKSQLNREGVFHNYHYYFTEDYLMISNLFTTDFVRIDFIRYISKHIVVKGKHQLYRLTMSNPEKMFFEKDFKLENCADEIMAELVKRNPHIDDRTAHVFDLPGAEVDTETENVAPVQEAVNDAIGESIDTTLELTLDSISTGTEDSENEELKIYTVKRRLGAMDEDPEEMKIYEVKRRLRKSDDDEENTDDE